MRCKAIKLLAFVLICAVELLGAEFFVAPNGDDGNPGTFDLPFATLETARDAARTLSQADPDQDFYIYLRAGRYLINQTVVFDWRDSLDYDFRLIVTGWGSETPILSAGTEVTGWTKVAVVDEPADLPAAASGNLWVADIPAGLGSFKCMFDEDGHLPRARMTGFQPEKEYDDPQASESEMYYPVTGGVKNWSNLFDIELIIRPQVPWTMNILPISSVDETNRIVTTSIDACYPMVKQMYSHWPQPAETAWIENTIEGLDSPGEWVVNTQTGRIYLWPRGDFPATIWAPTIKEIIRAEGSAFGQFAKNITFRQLIFEHGDRHTVTPDEASIQHDWEFYDQSNAMLRFRHAENCEVISCLFRDAGATGLRLDQHCKNISIAHNEFKNLGGSGVVLCGYGPGTDDRNMNHRVYNNHIHHCGLMYWHAHGIIVFQSRDNVISHNLIHNMPYNGMAMTGAYMNHFQPANKNNREVSRTINWSQVGGAGSYTWEQIEPFIHTRDNIVEYNEVHNVMEVMGDGNGFYIRFTPAGNIIRRNYFHDIIGEGAQAGIRCDGNQHGVEVYENIVYHCVRTAITTKGRNNIYNNILADTLHTNDPDNIHNVQFYSYLQMTPRPGDELDGAVFQRNIFYHDGPAINYYGDNANEIPDCVIDNNLYYNASDPASSASYLAGMQAQGADASGISTDPMFTDISTAQLEPLPGSPVYSQLGFIAIDQDAMGRTRMADLNADQVLDFGDLDILMQRWLLDGTQVQENGPLGWWKFDETSGTLAEDSSGNGYDGTVNTYTKWTSGQASGALDFDGTVTVSVPPALFAGIDNEISICFWQYGDPVEQPANQDVIFHGNNSQFGRILLSHLPWSNEMVYWDSGEDANGYDRLSNAVTPSQYEGQWNHWCFTKNAAAGSVAMYLNGQLLAEASGKTRPMSGITAFNIGSHAGGASGHYQGKIDDFRIYGYELSPSDVENLHDTGSNPSIQAGEGLIFGDLNQDSRVDYADIAAFGQDWLGY